MLSQKNNFYHYLLVLTLASPTASWAVIDTIVANRFLNVTVTGPADLTSLGKTIGNTGTDGSVSLCSNTSLTYDLAKIDFVPVTPVIGTFQSSWLYNLYDSQVSGISWSPWGWSPYFIGFNGYDYAPLPGTRTTVWQGKMLNSSRLNSPIAVAPGFQLIKDANRIPTGTIPLPRQTIYQYACYDTNNVLQETNSFTIAGSLKSSVTGCTPVTKTATIDMDEVPIAQIENASASTLIKTKQQAFALKCDPNISIHVSFVDLTNPGNTSSIANLTSDSTAAGVGYAVTIPGSKTPVVFGPDGSAQGIPNQTKYFLSGSSSVGTTSHTFSFSYVHKSGETVTPGTAKSMIGIVYSYQ